ncbi:MAG: two-component sensor histidine kinase [Gammaproteobacteria bacterium]|nr:two-component sensor histidine kinase [Gammaproteobacteria bacterium]
MIISIRRRLLANLLLTIILVSTTALYLSYVDSRQEVQELFDAQLAQSARVLHALVLPELELQHGDEAQTALDHFPRFKNKPVKGMHGKMAFGHEYERKLAFQVWRNNKTLLLRSVSSPEKALSIDALNPKNRGFSDEKSGDYLWRVFSLWDETDTYLIQVGERYDVRDELITNISNRLITPSLIALPILGILIWVGIGRGMQPLQKVAKEVAKRDPAYLEMMDVGPVPDEIKPLVTSLNGLFKQLRAAFEKERQFTDDAAHELRTPLAALKTQAQVALRSNDDLERTAALEKLLGGVDRASHLVGQMLTLARLDPNAGTIQRQRINIHKLAAEVVAQLVPKAIKKHINVELTGQENLMVFAEPLSLSVLIRNLVENAVVYTPEGGEIILKIDRAIADSVMLSVTDTGPGIDEKLTRRVFDRFFRVLGNRTSGCGLGLSIVKRIAVLNQLRVELKNRMDGQGLVATVYFEHSVSDKLSVNN